MTNIGLGLELLFDLDTYHFFEKGIKCVIINIVRLLKEIIHTRFKILEILELKVTLNLVGGY